MPVPIRPIKNHEEPERQDSIDYSFLANMFQGNTVQSEKIKATASNNDASLLFDLWLKSSQQDSNDTISIEKCGLSKGDITRLKTRGLVAGGATEIKFTPKGKKIITTMTLGEPNNFELNSQYKPYQEILASISKKGKPGYRFPRFATNQWNNLDLGEK